MKACIVLQNQYSKIGHAIALNLKARGVSEFCAYIFSPGAKEFILSQTDIRYDPILVDHELHARAEFESVDKEFIRRFEREYPEPNLWQYLYPDRKLMMSIGPKEESTAVIDPLYDHETLIKIFQARARAIEAFLLSARPDFILFVAIGALGHLILYHVAKKLGIQVINTDFPRIGNRLCLSEDYRTLTGVEARLRHFRENNVHDTPEHHEAKKFIDHYRATGSLGLEYYQNQVNHFIKTKTLFNPVNLIGALRYLTVLGANYWRHRKLFLYGIADQNPLRFIGQKLKQRFRKLRGYADLQSAPAEEDYVFYPLHYEPELATLVLSPFYFEQVQLISAIARSLPLACKLYVKEHPVMQAKRPRAFYRPILKLPNVKLISANLASRELIKNSRLVTTITSTVGFEACIMGKPVITFGDVFYNALDNVTRLRDIETLPQVVKRKLESSGFSEENAVDAVAAALQDSFPLDWNGLWYETDAKKLAQNPQIREFCQRLLKLAAKAKK